MAADTQRIKKVIIVGGGPTGLLLAVRLAQAGIPVQVLEAQEVVDENLRAALHGVPSICEFRRAGILHDVRDQGYILGGMTYRDVHGKLLARWTTEKLPADFDDALTVLPVNKLCGILRERVKAYKELIDLRYGHRVLAAGSLETGGAWVKVDTRSGSQRFEADYVVGCDGGKSAVRTSILGREGFVGHDWHVQIVTSNVYYDFQKHGWTDFNFVIDPENWFLAGLLPDNVWRITYGEPADISVEECKQRQPQRFKNMLPGRPEPSEYRVAHIAPYKIHQRCATNMRLGNVLLVSDAAHVMNPFSGFGMTCGLAEAGGVADCLIGINKGLADEAILDKYDKVRRNIFHTVADPASSSALRRMWNDDMDATMEEPFMKAVKQSTNSVEGTIAMQKGSDALSHDFTQYYQ